MTLYSREKERENKTSPSTLAKLNLKVLNWFEIVEDALLLYCPMKRGPMMGTGMAALPTKTHTSYLYFSFSEILQQIGILLVSKIGFRLFRMMY